MVMFDWEPRYCYDKINDMYRKGYNGRKKRRRVLRNNYTKGEPGMFERWLNSSNNNWRQKQRSIKNARAKANLDYHVDIIYHGTSRNNPECSPTRILKEQLNSDLKSLFSFSDVTLRLVYRSKSM